MVLVGQIVGAFGILGAVKVAPLTDFEDRFAPGSALVLDGERRRVEWSRPHVPVMVVKLSGLDTRTVAETHRGRYLEVTDEEVHQLPAGTWYHHELVGLEVATAGGHELGRLVQVLERPANDVWVAQRDGIEQLIPATQDAVLEVDVSGGRVVVADWLLEVEEA
jgi:16S rRNA processing protein RimM